MVLEKFRIECETPKAIFRSDQILVRRGIAMLNKKLVAALILMFLMPAAFLYTIRSTFAFNTLKNRDVFKEYENTAAESSLLYETIKSQNMEKFQLLYDSSSRESINLKNNLCTVLSYMKKQTNIADIKDFTGSFDGYSCTILAFSKIDLFKFLSPLFDYINAGGNAIFAITPDSVTSFSTIYRKLGIYEKGLYRLTYGMKLNNNILIKGTGQEFNKDVISTYSIEVQLDDDCMVYCSSGERIPLIWGKKYGKGNLMFTNGEFLISKQCRGLFAGMLGEISDKFIYPIMNAKVTFIDDFPSPTPSGYNERIYKDYGENIFNFYRDVWWPDMLEISKKYGLKYSGVFIQNYEDATDMNIEEKAGSSINPEMKSNLIFFGRELIRSEGELGIHGNNHQPLVTDKAIAQDAGYKPWNDEQSMINSLKEVNNFIKNVYPDYLLRSYVPPSNILSSQGRDALKKAIAELKIISSVYSNDVEGGGYTQEFGLGSDGIIDFPRISYGYSMNNYNRWAIYDGITTYGVFSHFVHPDDILDPERSSGNGWQEMRKDFENIISETYNNFSWLKCMTISEAGLEFLRYSDTDTAFKYDKDSVFGFCRNFKNHMYYILRTEKHIKKSSGCTVQQIDENVYLVYAQRPEFYIEMEDKI